MYYLFHFDITFNLIISLHACLFRDVTLRYSTIGPHVKLHAGLAQHVLHWITDIQISILLPTATI